ncbi:MAG: hypothetical protein HQK66_00355 [Desulfamplus sp.]|nr:hypothetical protein [Desulfamplus sp.]
MINQARISKDRKKELEQPDPFLESLYRGIARVKEYKKQLILTAGVFVAIVCIVSVTVFAIRSSDARASVMLAEALAMYDNNNPVEGYEAVKETFNSMLDEYPNTTSGRMATIRFADICYAAGHYQSAHDHYKEALRHYDGDPVIRDIVLYSLGHTCQALKMNKEAEEYFTRLAGRESSLMRLDGIFQLGMLAIERGESSKGIELMKKIEDQGSDSMYREMAEAIIARNN